MTIRSFRTHALTAGLVFVAGAFGVTSSAQAGFLDQLFGGGSAQPSQPTYNYQPPDQTLSPNLPAAPTVRQAPRKLVYRDPPQNKQRTTDLWHDKSLRVGDAVMMKDGIHIYLGSERARHSKQDFVAMDEVDNVPKREYAELTALDTTRNDPLKKGMAPDTLASGRSAAVATPISKGFRITDARGNSVRYVGP